MAEDYEAIDVPNGPPDMFPAGKVFKHKRGHSTHLNTVVDAPGGGFMVTPMLVPGQKDIGALLRGDRATDEQMQIAVDAATKRGNIKKYDSVDEALAAEQEWRKSMLPKIDEYVQKLVADPVH